MRTGIVALGLALVGCYAGVEGTPEEEASAPQPGVAQSNATQPATAQPATCPQLGANEVCTTANGEAGARVCDMNEQSTAESPTYLWTDCFSTKLCKPGDSRACSSPFGGGVNVCMIMGAQWDFTTSGCNTPLVLAFDPTPVTFTEPLGDFDLAGRETPVATTWVSSATPWLVMDRNSNGRIDDGAELFGSMSRLPTGERAKNGFLALAALDADGDGWITPRDPAFARLALWRDLDQDRASSPAELTPLADSVIALSLAYTDEPHCVAGGCERERADLVFRDRTGNERHGSVIDVYLSDR
jgi:hypothetical protein